MEEKKNDGVEVSWIGGGEENLAGEAARFTVGQARVAESKGHSLARAFVRDAVTHTHTHTRTQRHMRTNPYH